jgi:hypothetical protein
MIEFNKEYFQKPYYFFLKDRGNKISLYYSVSNTITEAKKEDSKIDFPKTKENKVKSFVSKILNSGKKISPEVIQKNLKKLLDDSKHEILETKLVAKILSKSLTSFLKTGEFELEKEDSDFLKSQSRDILKLLPIIIFQIVPGSTIATPFILELGKKLGIKLNSKIPEKYKKTEPEKESGELDEFIDNDGSLSNSTIPILDQGQHTQWTQDMRSGLNRMASGNFPYRSRIYFSESEKKEKVLDEEDFSDAYGYEEIEDDNIKSFKGCLRVFKNLEIKDPFERYERCMSFGFDPELDEEGKQRIVELQKDKMKQMIDELLLNKKSKETDVVKNNSKEDDSVISKILMRNIESIKKIAEKEGVDINKLIKHLKKGE